MSTAAIKQRSQPAERQPGMAASGLPVGVVVRDLQPHPDDRGVFTEFHRDEWHAGPRMVQWNSVRSAADVLRGVHVHRFHWDRIVLLDGVMLLALHDLRPDSPTQGMSIISELRGEAPRVASIPPGVAHGFFYPVPSLHVYAVSNYFNSEDELGCRFDTPELAFNWPTATPQLSKRDANAGGYDEMLTRYLARGPQPTETPAAR